MTIPTVCVGTPGRRRSVVAKTWTLTYEIQLRDDSWIRIIRALTSDGLDRMGYLLGHAPDDQVRAITVTDPDDNNADVTADFGPFTGDGYATPSLTHQRYAIEQLRYTGPGPA